MEQRPVSAWELADLATPWAVHVAVTLRLAEHIRDGVTRIDDLAVKAQVVVVNPRRRRRRRWVCWWHRGRRRCGWRWV